MIFIFINYVIIIFDYKILNKNLEKENNYKKLEKRLKYG
jgi:hypothetical protein